MFSWVAIIDQSTSIHEKKPEDKTNISAYYESIFFLFFWIFFIS
jgi:hypothetical protein